MEKEILNIDNKFKVIVRVNGSDFYNCYIKDEKDSEIAFRYSAKLPVDESAVIKWAKDKVKERVKKRKEAVKRLSEDLCREKDSLQYWQEIAGKI